MAASVEGYVENIKFTLVLRSGRWYEKEVLLCTAKVTWCWLQCKPQVVILWIHYIGQDIDYRKVQWTKGTYLPSDLWARSSLFLPVRSSLPYLYYTKLGGRTPKMRPDRSFTTVLVCWVGRGELKTFRSRYITFYYKFITPLLSTAIPRINPRAW